MRLHSFTALFHALSGAARQLRIRPHRFACTPHTYRSSDTGMVFVMMLVRRQYLAET